MPYNRRDTLHLLFLLDASGSMQEGGDGTTKWEAVDKGVMGVLQSVKREIPDARFSVYIFSRRWGPLFSNVPAENAPRGSLLDVTWPIQPWSQTALIDGIMFTLEHSRGIVAPSDQPVLLVLTDGMENASRAHSRKEAEQEIMTLEQREDWQAMFVGAYPQCSRWDAQTTGFQAHKTYTAAAGTYQTGAQVAKNIRSFMEGFSKTIVEFARGGFRNEEALLNIHGGFSRRAPTLSTV